MKNLLSFLFLILTIELYSQCNLKVDLGSDKTISCNESAILNVSTLENVSINSTGFYGSWKIQSMENEVVYNQVEAVKNLSTNLSIKSGFYKLNIQVGAGADAVINIKVGSNVVFDTIVPYNEKNNNFSIDRVINIASSFSNLVYSWYPTTGLSDATISTPVANPINNIQYIATVSDGNCIAHDTINLSVIPCNIEECSVDAGTDLTSTCGNSLQLNAEPKLVKYSVGISNNLKSVYFVSSSVGFAVGLNGVILKTIDGGLNWSKQNSGTSINLIKTYFKSSEIGYAAGGVFTYDNVNGTQYKNIILKTTNGGANWNKINSDFYYLLTAIDFINVDTCYMTADMTLQMSINSGKDWIGKNSPLGMTRCLKFIDKNIGFCTGSSGELYKTIDGAGSWSKKSTGVYNSLNSIYFLNKNIGYVVGNNGAIIKTNDGGDTWIKQTSNVTDTLNSVYFCSADTGYIVGSGGTVLVTKDGGSNWKKLNQVTTKTLNSVYFVDKKNGYVVGNGGTIFKITSPDSYSWLPTTSLDAYNISNPKLNPLITTSYVVTTVTNGCVAKDTVKVIVNPLTVNSGIDKSLICGGKVQFDNSVTNYTGSGILTYSWLPSTGLDNSAIARPTAEVTANTNFALQVSTPNGCIAKDTVKVTVNSFTVNSGLDKSLICGGKVQFDNPTTNYTGSGALTYAWLPSTGLDNAAIARPTAEVTTNTNFALQVSTPNGCIAKDTVKVIVNPLQANANDISFSCGNTAQLNVSTNYSGANSLTYKWTPSTGLSSSTIINPVATLKAQTTYSVEVKTLSGCSATANVNVNPQVIGFNPSICMVSVNENDKNVIVWQRENNAAIDSFFIFRESTSQTNQYNLIGKLPFEATGVFVDTLSNARVQSNKYKIATRDVCGFLTDKSSEHKTMHLTINKGIGNKWNLIWEQYVGLTVSSYKIYRGTTKANLVEIGSSAGGNTTYTDETAPIGDVYYQIGVVLPQACTNLKSTGYESSRSNIMSSADAVTGIANTSITETFIFPNPAFDKLNVFNTHSANATIMIFDLQGKQVLNKQVGNGQVDISSLSNGIYTVRLIDTGNIMINKLVKQ